MEVDKNFDNLFNKPVGIVVKTASPLSFDVLLAENSFVQLDDVLVCKSVVKRNNENIEVKFYGVVVELTKYLEGVDILYQEVKAKEGVLPVNPVYLAKINVNRIEPQYYIPPKPGDEVFKAFDEDRDKGLFFDAMETKIPAGLSQDGLPIYINYNFINGKDGAHISISGMSGVATKTSYSLFLINSIIQKSQDMPKFVIFNVKGKDLLFLDKENVRFKEEDREKFEMMGLEPKPFKDVAFYCPPEKPDSQNPMGAARYDVDKYGFSMKDFASERLLKYMFVENEQEISNLNFIIDRIASKLYELSKTSDTLIDDKAGREIKDLDDLYELLQEVYDEKDNDKERYYSWFGRNTSSQSIEAFLRRFAFGKKYIRNLIKNEKSTHIKNITKEFVENMHTLNVVDISDLHSVGKMFVVGVILDKIFKQREESGVSDPKIFVLLDELNKYAPKEGWSPIKDTLLDIAERGRSLGVILIGAQQTASEVEKRIVANSAIKVVGRLDTAELSGEQYGFLSKSLKQRVSMLKKGSMVLYQPDIPTPTVVSVPMPPWATRKEEVKDDEESEKILDDFRNIFG
ncbi:MAG: ATP-binding protein [Hydrogenobaculum sp.]|nr:MAG: ATP-binding protein [Hydrogenobaculum sp.]